MQPPPTPPSADTLTDWSAYALAYLRDQLNDAAPASLDRPALFPRSPLEGEGAVALFRFATNRGEQSAPAILVVGQTEPNYYPDPGLSDDEAFSLHLGTRFMLVMGIAQHHGPLPANYNVAEDCRNIVGRVAPDATVSDITVTASFEVEGELHTVIRCTIADKPVYVMANDAPWGFCERTDLAPQVAYRIHLGNVLRREPAPEE